MLSVGNELENLFDGVATTLNGDSGTGDEAASVSLEAIAGSNISTITGGDIISGTLAGSGPFSSPTSFDVPAVRQISVTPPDGGEATLFDVVGVLAITEPQQSAILAEGVGESFIPNASPGSSTVTSSSEPIGPIVISDGNGNFVTVLQGPPITEGEVVIAPGPITRTLPVQPTGVEGVFELVNPPDLGGGVSE